MAMACATDDYLRIHLITWTWCVRFDTSVLVSGLSRLSLMCPNDEPGPPWDAGIRIRIAGKSRYRSINPPHKAELPQVYDKDVSL